MANERRKRRRPPETPRRPRPETPEVVYTQPQPLGRKKLIMRLLTVAAVVAALFVGFSLFFRVEDVVVTGTRQYSDWTVVEASGIREGDGLLTFSKGKAGGKIIQSLPYVKKVRIGIRLPGTVNIYVEEVPAVYAIRDLEEDWWLMTGDGKLVEKADPTSVEGHTQILGLKITDAQVGRQAKAAEGTDPSFAVITDAKRLELALQIISRLEANEILGQVASVDTGDMSAVRLMYGDRYQVELGTPDKLEQKVDMLVQTVRQMGGHQSGILDISFADGQETVVYRPFQ